MLQNDPKSIKVQKMQKKKNKNYIFGLVYDQITFCA